MLFIFFSSKMRLMLYRASTGGPVGRHLSLYQRKNCRLQQISRSGSHTEIVFPWFGNVNLRYGRVKPVRLRTRRLDQVARSPQPVLTVASFLIATARLMATDTQTCHAKEVMRDRSATKVESLAKAEQFADSSVASSFFSAQHREPGEAQSRRYDGPAGPLRRESSGHSQLMGSWLAPNMPPRR